MQPNPLLRRSGGPVCGALLLLLVLTSLPIRALGQGGPGTGVNATFAKLFGEHKAFSAAADVIIDGTQKMDMPLQLAFLQNQMRVEVELSRIRGGAAAGQGELLKSMGMDRIVTISRLDRKSTLVIVPGLGAMVDSPMSEAEAASLDGDAKVEITEIGKDTIDAHPCTKNRFVISDKKGNKREGTVWNATDLKNFPVQLQMTEGKDLMTLKFKNIKLQPPEARLFVAPAGYKSYASMAELMGAAMSRMTGAAGN
jgi:hypothetical protein